MAHTTQLPTGHVISDDRTRLDLDQVHACLLTTPWAADRPRQQTERSFANCLALGLYAPGNHLVGFARVLTDYTFRAHLGDVFIHPTTRGLGLGKALVAATLAHPDLATVRTWTLSTADAHGLYARFGFELMADNGRRMTLDRA